MHKLILCLLILVASPALAATQQVKGFHRKTPYSPAALIVIDAGHGGNDPGTHSTVSPHYEEKNYTLRTAYYLRQDLRRLGYRTLMTRDNDTFIDLKKRAEIANNMHAAVFVSIHYNSSPKPAATGIEVFYYKNDSRPDRVEKSKKLGDQVHKELITLTHAKPRGVKHGNFAVIRETKMPAILVEGGFLTNKVEREKIQSASYQKEVAWGVAKGIDDYLKKK